MSILGVIARTRPGDAGSVRGWLKQFAGVEVAIDPGDGRFVLIIEDCAVGPAEVTMAEIALHPQIVNVSLAYEYSGKDAPSQAGSAGFAAWRASVRDLVAAT